MKYIFFFKKISDFDHLLPLVINLLNKGVQYNEIKLIELYPDLTLSYIEKDFRYKILKEYKLNLEKSYIGKLSLKIIKLINKLIYLIKVIKYPLIISKKILLFLLTNFYKLRLNYIFKSYEIKKVITDHSNTPLDKKLIYLANKYRISIYSLPHGTVLHNGYTNKSLHNILFPKKNNDNNFTKVIYTNNYHLGLSKNKSNGSNNLILGSIRYSKEWVNFLKTRAKSNKINNKFVKVLIFEEKSGIKSEKQFIPWINQNEIQNIINYLSKFNNCEIIVSKHPSIIENRLSSNPVNYHHNKSTFEMVNDSDIVIGCLTSALCDAIVLNKRTIFLPYCHFFNNNLINILPQNYMAKSFEEFKKIFNDNINGIRNKNKVFFQKKFYKEFIKCDDSDIFENYNNLINN